MRIKAKQRPLGSRSEMVRERRTQDTRKKMDKRAVQIHMSPVSSIPITMRAGSMGKPVMDRTHIRPKHLLSIPFLNSSVELKMPAIPEIKPGWRILSGFLTLTLTALIIFVYNSAQLRVNNLQVTGLNRIKVSEIADTLRLSDTPIFAVNPADVQKVIEKKFPELKEISVSVSLPAIIQLQVTERQPVAAWQYNDLTVWIDSEGYLFPAHGKAGNLLTIHAKSPPPLKSIEPVIDVQATTTAVDKTKSEKPSSPKIMDEVLLSTAIKLNKNLALDSNLVYNERNGLGWTDQNGWVVYVGKRMENLDQKMTVYKGIVNILSKQGTQPAVISVENLYAPYYRMEN